MTNTFYQLHPDFVAAVRAAYRAARDEARAAERSRRKLRAFERFSGRVYAVDGTCDVVVRADSPESAQMQRLADLAGYRGPILGELA